MPDVEFWSTDRKFGLKLPEEKMSLLLEMCAQSAPHETGGVLIGFYTNAHDCAVVTAVSRAPSDSQSGRAYFFRGIRDLQRWIDYVWRRKSQYYLGEWHFHPHGAPLPSSTDTRQMREIAETTHYQCPEPILLIVGGNPPEKWAVRAYVSPRGKDIVELIEK
jgi:integrative and conjugative element protein (TIGR02256 family)